MQIYSKSIVISRQTGFSYRDFISLSIFFIILVMIAKGANQMTLPISTIENSTISLAPSALPEYALATVLRMFVAIFFSIIFAIVYGTLAAKSKYAEKILIPALDIFQSIPVLGYISFTVTGFLAMFPGNTMGLELASIFAAFTNQVPNVTFSVYQSLKNIPEDLKETCTVFGVSPRQKFFALELPFAMPGLIWNGMMSMSGSWFLIVASEAITVNQKTIMLPGVGSYIAQAINQHDLDAIGYAVICMLAVILMYDQLVFRPLVAWGDKFHSATNENTPIPKSIILDLFRKSKIIQLSTSLIAACSTKILFYLLMPLRYTTDQIIDLLGLCSEINLPKKTVYLWYILIAYIIIYSINLSADFIDSTVGWEEFVLVIKLGFFTMIRVLTMILLAAIIWVPIGVYVGLRPSLAEKIEPIAQFLAAFPANLLFPLAVIFITKYSLDANIWLSPLMILGTQWYILFNVIAGTSALSTDLIHASNMLDIKGRLWWQKVILPGIFPYLVTGCITAAGGAWNASIIAEIVSWGNTQLVAEGIGAYITQATLVDNFPKIIIGIGIMSLYVIILNKLVWRPLYNLAEEKTKLG